MNVEQNSESEVKCTQIGKEASFWLEALGIGEDAAEMPGAVVEQLYSLGFLKISINRAGFVFLETRGWKFT